MADYFQKLTSPQIDSKSKWREMAGIIELPDDFDFDKEKREYLEK